MHGSLAHHVRIAFGLAFDVEKDSGRKSGFKPALFDSGGATELFGKERLEGFAAALNTNFADRLIVIGGKEGRYPTEDIFRAEMIREMLIHDFGCDSERILALRSHSNTGGNITIIRDTLRDREIAAQGCAVLSSHYHLPRAQLDLFAASIFAPLYSAEAFTLLENPSRKNALIETFGGGALAERMLAEIQGVADKVRGSYVPRTDAAPVVIKERVDRTV